jgi:hypothetical protein
MVVRDKREVAGMINARDFDGIQREITDMTVGVKSHVFVDVFKGEEQNMVPAGKLFGDIDISKLKTALESKDNKRGKRVLSDKLETLMPMMRDAKLKSRRFNRHTQQCKSGVSCSVIRSAFQTRAARKFLAARVFAFLVV